MNYLNENVLLKNKIENLTEDVSILRDKLKNYVGNERQKRYYAKHKDIVKQRNKQYLEKIKKTNPEKLKKWKRKCYLKYKQKKKMNSKKIIVLIKK